MKKSSTAKWSAIFLALALGAAPLAAQDVILSGEATGFSTGPDETPDSFAFSAIAGAEPGSVIVAPTFTVAGIDTDVTASVSGDGNPGFRVNGGSLVSSATISAGDSVTLSLETAAATYSTSYLAALTIGTETENFSVTTRAQDSTPDAFTIAALNDVAPATLVLSESVRISGLLDPAPVSVSGQGSPEFSTDSGQTWTASGSTGSISNNGQVLIRLTSGAVGETRTATLTVGGVTSDFIVTTAAADTTPDAFVLTAQTGVEPATLTVSSPVSISGITAPTPVSLSGTGSPEFSTDSGFTWTAAGTSGTVSSGQQVLVRLTSGALGETRTATLSVGGVTADFSVTSRQAPTPPDAFTITAVTGATPNTVATSDPVTITGLTADVPVTISGEGSPEFSTDAGSTWKAAGNAGTVANNGQILVRLTAGTENSTRTATLFVGGVMGNFVVTARAFDTTPNAYSFTAVSNATTATMISSETVAITGLLDPAPVSISGAASAAFRINSGAWTSAPASINNGDTLQVRLASSSTGNQALSATTNVGGVSAAFTVTTKADDPCASSSAAVGTSCSDGAIYAGLNSSGEKFYLASSNNGLKAWKTSQTFTPGTTMTDGWYNQKAMEQLGISVHTAAAACAAKGANWYLPSEDELRIAYQNLPAKFLASTYYWTSEHFFQTNGSQTYAKRYAPSTGTVNGLLMDNATGAYVQCVRHDGNRVYADPCAGAAPVVGARCEDGSVYVGKIDSKKIMMAVFNKPGLYKLRATRTAIPGTTSETDGYANTQAMTGAAGTYPAAEACRTIGADWFIPSRSEFALVQADYELWPSFATTTHSNSYHWTSTQHTTTTAQWVRGLAGAETGYFVDGKAALRCFKSSTAVTDSDPNAFSFTAVSGAALDTLVSSSAVTISGINTAASFVLTGDGSPAVSINGGAFVTSGTISNGQSVVLRMTSAAVSDVTRTAYLKIGGVTGSFSVSTGAVDTTPNAFAFTSTTDAAQNTAITSGSVTISGINIPADATISGDGTPQFSVNGGSWTTSAKVANSDSVRVRLTSAASGNVTRSATLVIGGVSGSYAVTTGYDTTPDAFTFVDRTGVEPNTTIISAPVTLAGFEQSLAVTASNGAEFRIDGGSWVTSGSISAGQTLEVKLTSGTFNATTSATVTIGSTLDTFSVTTRDGDAMPDPFSISDLTNQEPTSYVTSSTVTLSGLDVAQISVSSGSAQISVNGGAYATSGTVTNGSTVKLRVLTGYAGTTSTSTIRITNYSGTTQVSFNWSVATRAPTGVDAFDFNWGYSYCSNNLCTASSNIVTISGETLTPQRLTIPFQEGNKNTQLYNYPVVKINGGDPVHMSTINSGNYTVLPGDTVQLITWPEPGTSGETRQTLCVGEACAKYRWSNSFVYSSDPRPNGASTLSSW